MVSSVESYSSKTPGRPRGLTRRQADQRRMQCYDLWLKGFSEPQIAGSVGISQPAVSKYLSSVFQKNAEWFENAKDPNNRYRGMFKLALDRVEQVLREQWFNYHHTPEDKTLLKSAILSRVLDGIALQCRVLGLSAAEVMDSLFFTEQYEGLLKKLEEMKRRMEEQGMADRILPFPQARLPPPPQQ